MLPKAHRLRTSLEFALTTKVGLRASSNSLVLYVHSSEGLNLADGPKVGLIVNKSVGGSVIRHRVSRQLRHAIAQHLVKFPKNSYIVIRVLRAEQKFDQELAGLVQDISKKLAAKSVMA